MNFSYLQAVALGLAQGIAEFLPISSSGHLELVQRIFSIESTGSLLKVLLHCATLVVVLVTYFKLFINMIRHPVRSLLPELIVATIPAVIAALLLNDFFDEAFEGKFLGFSFLITSVVLVLGDIIASRVPTHNRVTWRDAIVMGLMQAFAILPGVSRFGSTLAGGTASGLRRRRAADFSFIMSAPAILGSLVLALKDLLDEGTEQLAGTNWGPVLVSMAVACAAGFAAIHVMLRIMRRAPLSYFAIYTGLLGCYVLLDQYVLHILF